MCYAMLTDEFAIGLSGVRESAHAKAIADKVVAAIGQPFCVGAHSARIGAGVDMAPARTRVCRVWRSAPTRRNVARRRLVVRAKLGAIVDPQTESRAARPDTQAATRRFQAGLQRAVDVLLKQ